MALVLVSFILIATVILIMSVGVIMGRKPVQGSCGGLNTIGGMDKCELCGGSTTKCEELSA
ncbi:MAG: (Na+)-NQR maturation NqrM [Pseudohongiellaceae bacterium]